MRRRSFLTLMLFALLGCTNRHLLFTTYTKLGIDVSGSNTQPPEAVLGYKRFEGAVLPYDPETTDQDPPAVLAGIVIKNRWIKGICLKQVFATGEAATQSTADGASELVEFLQETPEDGPCSDKD